MTHAIEIKTKHRRFKCQTLKNVKIKNCGKCSERALSDEFHRTQLHYVLKPNQNVLPEIRNIREE